MSLLKDNLIARYRMNENTASDNDELVTNGDFANWTGDNPDSWSVGGESGNDPEILRSKLLDISSNTISIRRCRS